MCYSGIRRLMDIRDENRPFRDNLNIDSRWSKVSRKANPSIGVTRPSAG